MDRMKLSAFLILLFLNTRVVFFFFLELFDYGKASLLVLTRLLFLLNVHTCLPAQCSQVPKKRRFILADHGC